MDCDPKETVVCQQQYLKVHQQRGHNLYSSGRCLDWGITPGPVIAPTLATEQYRVIVAFVRAVHGI